MKGDEANFFGQKAMTLNKQFGKGLNESKRKVIYSHVSILYLQAHKSQI